MAEEFDAIIIGAGEAGAVIANRAIQAGKRTALIYREPYGSTCVNTGCVPSKFLIYRAKVAHLARVAHKYHIGLGPPTINIQAMIEEKNELIREHRHEAYQNAKAAQGLSLFEGRAQFLSAREVNVNGHHLRSEKIFIATGMRPAMPRIAGLDLVSALNNETVMQLTEVPEHLIVIGGGYIACELGQAFHRYGSHVTIIQNHEHLCPLEEPDVSTLLERAFRAERIDLLLRSTATQVEPTGSGVRVKITSKDGKEPSIEGSHLLVAAGRRANTDTLGLEAAGVNANRKGFVMVNDYLETNVPGIWAVGDVNGQQPFTRVCQEEGKVAFANAFEGARLKVERLFLGHAVFSDPEIGSVGLTEREARERDYDVAAGLVTFDKVEKAELIGQTTGLMKYVVDRSTRRVLGAHVIGPDAADLIYDAIIVMRHGGTIDEIAKAVGIFPTLQEGMEGTARGLLRKLAPDEVDGPLATVWTFPLQTALAAPEGKGEPSKKHRQQISREHAAGLQCPACGAEFETQAQVDSHQTMHHQSA